MRKEFPLSVEQKEAIRKMLTEYKGNTEAANLEAMAGTVFSQVSEEDLLRYQKAAELSGFEVVVDARAGETWRFFKGSEGYDQPGWRSVVIREGFCGIRIIKPEGHLHYTHFGKGVKNYLKMLPRTRVNFAY